MKRQETGGSWHVRWGVSYLYGTVVHTAYKIKK
ncbi:hypothetical protein [Paenibacillus sp.]|nr:hypothetical protein [Paenibacillus sp.]